MYSPIIMAQTKSAIAPTAAATTMPATSPSASTTVVVGLFETLVPRDAGGACRRGGVDLPTGFGVREEGGAVTHRRASSAAGRDGGGGGGVGNLDLDDDLDDADDRH